MVKRHRLHNGARCTALWQRGAELPEEFAALIKKDQVRAAKVIEAAEIKAMD